MQRSLLALMVVLAILYGCGQEASKKPFKRVAKPTAAELLAPEPPASITSVQDEAREMIERACKDWASKDMGTPPTLCYPAGLSPAFCHSASRASFCK